MLEDGMTNNVLKTFFCCPSQTDTPNHAFSSNMHVLFDSTLFCRLLFQQRKKTTAFEPNISRVSSLLFSFRSCSICRSASLRQEPGATNLSNCWLSSTSWLQSDYQTSILRVEPSRVESSRLLNTLLFISSLRGDEHVKQTGFQIYP